MHGTGCGHAIGVPVCIGQEGEIMLLGYLFAWDRVWSCCWDTCLHGTWCGHAVGESVCTGQGEVMLLGYLFAWDRA